MENLNGKFKRPFQPGAESKIEWLETNNSGAYASSSVIELHRRKYHGLLVTPVDGHEGRYHILSGIDLTIDGQDSLTTGTAMYPDAFFPEGWKQLESVSLAPVPEWKYRSGRTLLKKEVFMRKGDTAVWIAYTVEEGPQKCSADLKFLFTFRNSHSLTQENSGISTEAVQSGDYIRVHPYEALPAADIVFSGKFDFTPGLYWDRNICYKSEKKRRLEWVEDRFVPGKIKIELKKNEPFIIRVGISGSDALTAAGLKEGYRDEQSVRKGEYREPETALELLKNQSRHFFLKNPSGKMSINAGYPWFGEWGRDTMLALPGLTCASGRIGEGISILSDYISLIKDGLLPNTLGDTQGFTSYNSIDAGLLFCWALNKLIDMGCCEESGTQKWLAESILPAVESIVEAFAENRVPQAEIDPDGLLKSGTPDTQLTWMDAKAWGKPVTPRYGYAVELNALWWDAMILLSSLKKATGRKPGKALSERINSFPAAFISKFWIAEGGYLSDTVNENGQDGKIRPNMLFASSAREGLMSLEKIKSVVKTAEKHLLTEYGLRTLSPTDPDFYGVYTGTADERDSRYHQGTVWPWLIGIMVESSLKASVDIDTKKVFWSDYLDNLLSAHLYKDGWGSVSEIFDGLVPRAGKGCFAQAWSCGEIIRAAELTKRK